MMDYLQQEWTQWILLALLVICVFLLSAWPACPRLLERYRDWRHFLTRHDYIGKREVVQHRAVYNKLVELRAVTDADRASVIRFHNGNEFLLSDPVWKCTCTHEAVKAGVSYEAVNMQNVLVSIVTEMVEPMISGVSLAHFQGLRCSNCPSRDYCSAHKKYLAVIDVESMQPCYAKHLLIGKNVKTLVLRSLSSTHGPFGYVAVDVTGYPAEEHDVQIICEKLCRYADEIEFLFTKKLKS
jgi:hypothetical protein